MNVRYVMNVRYDVKNINISFTNRDFYPFFLSWKIVLKSYYLRKIYIYKYK